MIMFIGILFFVMLFSFPEFFSDLVWFGLFWLFCVMMGLHYLGLMHANEQIKNTFYVGVALFIVLQIAKKLRRS